LNIMTPNQSFIYACTAFALILASCARREADRGATRDRGQIVIGVMPKLVGIEYFNACERGALEAGRELGVTVRYDGPPTNDVAAQAQLVETWINRGYHAIAVAPNDPDRIAPALSRAKKKGVAVLTYDADAAPSSRDVFVNQSTYADIAQALVDVMAEGIGPNGKYVILTGSLTAANQNHWIAEIEEYTREHFPRMVNLRSTPLASEEDQALATQVTIDALKADTDIQGIYAITSVALPGAAEGLRKAQASGRIFLTGLATPKTMRPYVADGTVKKFVLWSPIDLGYLTVYAANMLATKTLPQGTIQAGRLGEIQVVGDQVLLGPPIVFDASNIDQYDF
jgi:ABC-type sugar transport system substrate-binding protein